MDKKAKAELARALQETARIREASWNGKYYGKTVDEAANEATSDPDIQDLARISIGSGYTDFPDWADRVANKK